MDVETKRWQTRTALMDAIENMKIPLIRGTCASDEELRILKKAGVINGTSIFYEDESFSTSAKSYVRTLVDRTEMRYETLCIKKQNGKIKNAGDCMYNYVRDYVTGQEVWVYDLNTEEEVYKKFYAYVVALADSLDAA